MPSSFTACISRALAPVTLTGSAISSPANCKLVIGSPGKGNVISGNYCGALIYLQNAVIQSNFFGIYPDGEKRRSPILLCLSSDQQYDNLLFGGALATDGNVVLAGSNGGLVLGTGTASALTKTATIENNFFGTDYKGCEGIKYLDTTFYTSK